MIDLRSDTVTRPGPAMRRAMAEAAVGDDVYGEDPSVRELEEMTAALLGKPAALFVPSGTMANQLALLTQTRPGNEVIVGAGAHVAWHEAGAAAAWAGVQFAVAGEHGIFTAPELERALKPSARHTPRAVLACLENTHNLAGGRIFPEADVTKIREFADQRGLFLHLDGARLWNASAATGAPPARLAAAFDTVSVCYSKGLGAPVGSALAGSQALISEAWRFRKMLGGGMRQAGVLAAACLYALRHQRDELELDHDKARRIAATLKEAGADLVEPETNIVLLRVEGAEHIARSCAERGVLLHAMAPDKLRLVTHRDISLAQAISAAQTVAECLRAAPEA